MIRWNYAAPRLAVAAVILLVLWLGLNPAVRWAVRSVGQSATSSKVDVGRVETSLLRTEVCLNDVAVADPRAKRRNLFEADRVVLRVDGDSLLRRKFVVREGRISGLRLGTARDTSGRLGPAGDWSLDLPQVDLPRLDQEWLDQLDAVLKQKLVDQANQLASVQLARELFERWPAEYDRIEARTDSLKRRIDNLHELSKIEGKNVLRAVDAFQQAATELENVRRELRELRGEIDRLGRQVAADKEAIVRAKEKDLRAIRRTVRLENLNPENLSNYFLGPELSETIGTIAQWVQWGRQCFPSEIDDAEASRSRGVDVAFPEVQPRPDFLIESLVVDGRGQLGRRKFLFRAKATGITTEPKLYGKPVVLKARIDATAPLAVEAVFDHTGKKPRQRITIDCPRLPQPERVLGRPGELALVVAPGNTHLWASLELKGDKLAGQVLLKQEPVEIAPDLGDGYGGQRLAGSLKEALSEVRQIRVTVDLSGTLDKPRWQLTSNLGAELAGALNGLLQRELVLHREELAAHVDRHVDDQVSRLEQAVRVKQEEFLAGLDVDGAQLQGLNQVIAQRLRLPATRLSEGLPKGLPLRF